MSVENNLMPANEAAENKAVWMLRLNFANGSRMSFTFEDKADPTAVAQEITDFLRQKVEFHALKVDGKSPFVRKSDVIPNRRVTLDILCRGAVVQSALMGVDIKPAAIFKNEGELFLKLSAIILRQAAADQAKKELKEAVRVALMN